ncbi:MAG: hypothetical protein OXU20_25855 [Myxococcales bacterium]|nr:hypothetical protein [Myxococcales bacterium]MDD9970473.1 hypothetical protein [Myxococcales bacterium]
MQSRKQPTQSGPRQAQADAEFNRWRKAQERLAQQQRTAEYRRLLPQVQSLAGSNDRPAIERLVSEITGSAILDPVSKRELNAPLRDRLVLLLCGEAVTALAAGQTTAGRMRIIAATNAYGMRGEGAPGNVVGAIAQAQAKYVDAAVGLSEKAALAGKYDAAIAHADRARTMLALLVRSDSPEAELAKRRVAEVDRMLVAHEVGKTLSKAKRAEARNQLRLALFHYREAQRAGMDTQQAIDRLVSQKRSPGLEMALSGIVPGLSQLTHNRLLAGSAFLLATGASAVGGVLLNASAEERYDEYLGATDPERAVELYDGIWPREAGAYALIGTAVVLHIWNIIDAYSDATHHNRMHFQ